MSNKSLSIEEMDDPDSILESRSAHDGVTDLDEDQFSETRSTKPKKIAKPAPRAKKSFPLVPALAAVAVVVGGAMGWQWWSQHHGARAIAPPAPMNAMGAHATGSVGLMPATPESTQHPLMGDGPGVAPIGVGQLPHEASAPPSMPDSHVAAMPSPGAPAAPAPTMAASRPGMIAPQVKTAESVAPQAAQDQPPVVAPPAGTAQVDAAAAPQNAAVDARLDAMEKEIHRIAWRISALQSDMNKRQSARETVQSKPSAVVAHRAEIHQVQIVAINNGQAVITVDGGAFRKVSVGDRIADMGRVIRVDDAGIQTSGAGWIKR